MPEIDGRLLLMLCMVTCVVPALILAAVTWWLIRRSRAALDDMIAPDVNKLAAYGQQIRQGSPNISNEQLLTQVINRQAFRTGAIGAVTGLGGLVTLPIALPIDIVMTSQIQIALVEYIAQTYGKTSITDQGFGLGGMILSAGGARLTTSSSQYAIKIATRFLGKSLSKLIPVVGFVTGFALNYFLTQLVGRAAIRLYAGEASQPQVI